MIKNFRLHVLKQIDSLTDSQLNKIPTGYNNNIIWNLGHMLSVELNMCYVRSGLPVAVNGNYVSSYLPGTRPEQTVERSEIRQIKEALITSIDQLQADLDNRRFKNYSPSVMIPKIYGFEVTNIEEVLAYLLYHEGYHGGYILSLKHLV